MTFDDSDASQVPDRDDVIEQVLGDLDTPCGILPVESIRAAQQLGPQIVPGLISLIREATAAARDDRVVETNGHFFALFLLVEFRAREAWPAILEMMLLPGDWTSALFGDGNHSALPQAVMAMAHDRIEEVVSVIRNVEVDEYVRWAMMIGLAMCVIDGSHSRLEIVSLLRDLLRECLVQKSEENTTELVSTLTHLYPAEAYEEIQKAFDEELVFEGVIDRESVSKQIEEGEKATIDEFTRSHRPFTDTVETLRSWSCFAPKRSHSPAKRITLPSVDSPPETVEQVKRGRDPKPQVGRNDPCPCGSGKKFKKCCLR